MYAKYIKKYEMTYWHKKKKKWQKMKKRKNQMEL